MWVHARDQQQVDAMLRAMDALDVLAGQLTEVPDRVFTNALLNSAVERLLKERGLHAAAGAFSRLAALLNAGLLPRSHEAWPLLDRVDA